MHWLGWVLGIGAVAALLIAFPFLWVIAGILVVLVIVGSLFEKHKEREKNLQVEEVIRLRRGEEHVARILAPENKASQVTKEMCPYDGCFEFLTLTRSGWRFTTPCPRCGRQVTVEMDRPVEQAEPGAAPRPATRPSAPFRQSTTVKPVQPAIESRPPPLATGYSSGSPVTSVKPDLHLCTSPGCKNQARKGAIHCGSHLPGRKPPERVRRPAYQTKGRGHSYPTWDKEEEFAGKPDQSDWQCRAFTRDWKRCGHAALREHGYCWQHGAGGEMWRRRHGNV